VPCALSPQRRRVTSAEAGLCSRMTRRRGGIHLPRACGLIAATISPSREQSTADSAAEAEDIKLQLQRRIQTLCARLLGSVQTQR
jgi:hypothetical protein